MEKWLGVQTLIWLLPVVFIIHDFEEIIRMEKWVQNHSAVIAERLPEKWADRMKKQFSMSTAQFAVAVLVIFLFVTSSAYMASQYLNKGPLGSIYFFTVVMLVLFLHIFTHIGQSLFFRSITPGVITSVVLLFPYSIMLFQSLFKNEVINWNTILLCLPFVILILPIVFFAHWVGKKLI